MDQLDHDIVQDLLPLYHDGVCSDKSRAAVEEHLQTCEACRAALTAMDAPLPEVEKAADDAAVAVKKISGEWKRGKRRAHIIGVIVAVVVCAAAAVGIWTLTTWTCIPMDGGDYTLDVYRLKSGGVGGHWDFREGRETWYALVRYYVAVTSLAELRSQGQRFYTISWATSNPIEQGDRGVKVEHLQYMLSVLSAYIPEIPPVTIDGIFGPATRSAVIAAQRRFGLPETGIVNFDTWYEIYDQFSGIETIGWGDTGKYSHNRERWDPENYPYTAAIIGGTPPRNRYAQSTTLTQFPGNPLSTGNQDPVRQEAPR